MDLSAFHSGARSGQGNTGWKAKYSQLKNWLYPATKDKRKERMGQYKDLSIFLGSILAVVIFEDKIKNFLEIETDEISRISRGQ